MSLQQLRDAHWGSERLLRDSHLSVHSPQNTESSYQSGYRTSSLSSSIYSQLSNSPSHDDDDEDEYQVEEDDQPLLPTPSPPQHQTDGTDASLWGGQVDSPTSSSRRYAPQRSQPITPSTPVTSSSSTSVRDSESLAKYWWRLLFQKERQRPASSLSSDHSETTSYTTAKAGKKARAKAKKLAKSQQAQADKEAKVAKKEAKRERSAYQAELDNLVMRKTRATRDRDLFLLALFLV